MSGTPQPVPARPLAAAAPITATAEQQRVLDRIALQRERLAGRRAAMAQARAVAEGEAPAIPADAPLLDKLVIFARRHPWAVAGVVAAGLVAGPSRLVRWSGVIWPLVMRMRR